jgi:hypothetical protein
MKTQLITLLLISMPLIGFSQSDPQTQTIKGSVKDLNSEFPLPGVNIILVDSDPFIGAATDEKGTV